MPLNLLAKLPVANVLAGSVLGAKDQTLGSKETLKEALRAAFTEGVPVAELAGLPASIDLRLTGELEAQLLNEAEDIDDLGIYGEPANGGWGQGWLRFSKDTAWLRYRAALQARTTATAKLPAAAWAQLGVALDAEGQAEIVTYRPHHRKTELFHALRDDLTSLPTLLSLERLQDWPVHQVLLFSTRGALKTELKVTLADFLPAALTHLARHLAVAGRTVPLATSLSAGVTVQANVDFEGSFQVAVHKTGLKAYRLAVAKATTRSVGGSGGLKVGVSVTIGAALSGAEFNQLRQHLVSQLLANTPVPQIQELKTKLMDRVAETLWGEPLRGAAQNLRAALEARDPDLVGQPWSEVLARLQAFEDEVKDRLTQGFATSLELGLQYAWNRVETHEVLLEGTLTEAEFRAVHRDLLAMRVGPVLRKLDANAGLVFLDTRTLVTTSRFALGLNVGLFSLGYAVKRARRVATTRNRLDEIRCAYTSSTDKEIRALANRTGVTATLSAETATFRRREALTMDEFALGLHVLVHHGDGQASLREVGDYLDTAALWGAVPARGTLLTQLATQVRDWHRATGGELRITIGLRASDAVLRMLWRTPPTVVDLGSALAAAMRPHPKHALTQDLASREETYRQLWAEMMTLPPSFFAKGIGGARTVRRKAFDLAEAHLTDRDLVAYETGVPLPGVDRGPRGAAAGTTAVFANFHQVGAVLQTPEAHRRIHRLALAGVALGSSTSSRWEAAFADYEDALSLLYQRPYYARFYGRLLWHLAQKEGLPPEALHSTLTIEAVRKGETLGVLAVA